MLVYHLIQELYILYLQGAHQGQTYLGPDISDICTYLKPHPNMKTTADNNFKLLNKVNKVILNSQTKAKEIEETKEDDPTLTQSKTSDQSPSKGEGNLSKGLPNRGKGIKRLEGASRGARQPKGIKPKLSQSKIPLKTTSRVVGFRGQKLGHNFNKLT